MRPFALTFLLFTATPLAAQDTPAQWDDCIAAPDAPCVLGLALSETLRDQQGDSANYSLRRLVELHLAMGQPDQAARLTRLVDGAGDQLYLWRQVLAARSDPDDVAHAVGLIDMTSDGAYLDLYPIIRALLVAGDTTAASALIAQLNNPEWRDNAEAELAATLAPVVVPPPDIAQLESRVGPAFGESAFYNPSAKDLAEAIASLPPDQAVAEGLRIAGTDMEPMFAASTLIAVLAATGDSAVEDAAVAVIDRIDDPVQRALARIDLAPHLRNPIYLARLQDWAAVPGPESERAFMLAEFAAATGQPDLSEKAVARLADIDGDVDRRDYFTAILQAVARSDDPARVETLLRLFPDERPTSDKALALSVADMARRGQADLAIRLSRSMTYDEQMVAALGRIAAVTGDAALLSEALVMARDQVSDVYRDQVLIDLATALAEVG